MRSGLEQLVNIGKSLIFTVAACYTLGCTPSNERSEEEIKGGSWSLSQIDVTYDSTGVSIDNAKEPITLYTGGLLEIRFFDGEVVTEVVTDDGQMKRGKEYFHRDLEAEFDENGKFLGLVCDVYKSTPTEQDSAVPRPIRNDMLVERCYITNITEPDGTLKQFKVEYKPIFSQ